MKFSLYHVNEKYLNFIQQYDKKVLKNHDNYERPYVGIIYNKNKHDYFIPLTSKTKKIDKRVFISFNNFNKHFSKGGILINNSIPVNKRDVELIDFNLQDKKYKQLLKKESIIVNQKDLSNELVTKFNKFSNY